MMFNLFNFTLEGASSWLSRKRGLEGKYAFWVTDDVRIAIIASAITKRIYAVKKADSSPMKQEDGFAVFLVFSKLSSICEGQFYEGFTFHKVKIDYIEA